MIIFDKTNYQTFARAQKIMSILQDLCSKEPKTLILLLSNKNDLENVDNQVNEDEVQSYINNYTNISYFKISIDSKLNISKVKDLIKNFFENNEILKRQTSLNNLTSYYPKYMICPLSSIDDEIPTLIKIILIGNSAVGKTSYCQRLIRNSFMEGHLASIGISDSTLAIKILRRFFRVEIWDTAGQDRFRAIPKKYYEKVDGVILMYDITNEDSFNGVTRWLSDIRESTDNKLIIYLLANKVDLYENRKISQEEGQKLAAEKESMKYVEVSVKWDLNIKDVFFAMIIDIYTSANPRSQSLYLNGLPLQKKKILCCQ